MCITGALRYLSAILFAACVAAVLPGRKNDGKHAFSRPPAGCAALVKYDNLWYTILKTIFITDLGAVIDRFLSASLYIDFFAGSLGLSALGVVLPRHITASSLYIGHIWHVTIIAYNPDYNKGPILQ